MADQIWMRFGMIGRMGPRMRQIVGFGDRFMGGGNFRGKCGAPHCNQYGVCRVVWTVSKLVWAILFCRGKESLDEPFICQFPLTLVHPLLSI